MKNFRLLAIIPLKDCSSRFSKNLTIGKKYQFYHEYQITLATDNSSVDSVTARDEILVPKDFYSLKNGISINFSAVVGKNGSGKSALIELFYYAIYLLGSRNTGFLTTGLADMQNDKDELEKDYKEMQRAGNLSKIIRNLYGITNVAYADLLSIRLMNKHDIYVDTMRSDSMRGIHKIVTSGLFSKISDLENFIEWEAKFEQELGEFFHVSILYETDGLIRELLCESGNVIHNEFSDNSLTAKKAITVAGLHELFYSISLNFSHHGLNSTNLGHWITRLFHKNDAYTTPLVINPMRHEGNFDINHEQTLSRERLMSTLAYQLLLGDKKPLLSKYTCKSFIFTVKSTSKNPVYTDEDFDALDTAPILRALGIGPVAIDVPFGEEAINYLHDKITKVQQTYPSLVPDSTKKMEGLKLFIKEDKSHITKKIRQVVNYLKVADNPEHGKLWGRDPVTQEVVLSSANLKTYLDLFTLKKTKVSPDEIIDYALPGLFRVNFEFLDNNDAPIFLSAMSSGEQQMIFNINSILYHLYNIQSVHNKSITKKRGVTPKGPRVAYSNINILLDEIELYYHPEMQRQLVSNLMEAFERLKSRGGIHSINVCILTHSPFILSDIPVQNVLRLDKEAQGENYSDDKTFAANIHDLLRKDFLLENGFMGAFASTKINRIIDSLQAQYLFRNSEEKSGKALSDSQKAKLLRSEGLNSLTLSEVLTQQQCEESITLVGEPVLYRSLVDLYGRAFPKVQISFIDQQIAYLEQLKKQK